MSKADTNRFREWWDKASPEKRRELMDAAGLLNSLGAREKARVLETSVAELSGLSGPLSTGDILDLTFALANPMMSEERRDFRTWWDGLPSEDRRSFMLQVFGSLEARHRTAAETQACRLSIGHIHPLTNVEAGDLFEAYQHRVRPL